MSLPHLMAGASCALLFAFAAVANAETDMLLIFDASGSMKAETSEGVTRIDAAKEAFSKLTETLKTDSVALMIFGHRLPPKDPKACQDIELAIPFGKLDAARFRGTVAGIKALGNTPLAGSLLKAKDALLGLEKDSQKAIVLFTDGIESCGGNPEAVARELAAMGINVKVHVVGFAVDDAAAAKLKAIADAGGGKFVLAKNAGELEQALPQLVKTALRGTEQTELERSTILDEPFEGTALAERWEVTRTDEARLAVLEGKLVVIAAPAPDWRKNETVKNLVTLKQPLEAANFELTGKVSLKIEGQNRGAALLLMQDDRNYLELAVYGNEWGNNVQRVVKFTKVIDGKGNFLQRQIEIGPAKAPETIELKIVRVGALFEAYARGFGKEPGTWQRIGEHAAPFATKPRLVLKSAQSASGSAPDLEAAFDDLKVDAIVYETKIIGGEKPANAIFSTVFDEAAKFEEDFEILQAEPGYQTVQTGLVIAAKNGWFAKPQAPVRNLALLKTPLPEGDYEVTLQMSLRITSQQNFAGLALYQDDQNVLVAGYGGQPWGNNINRQAFGEKITSGESTVVRDKVNRFGAAPDPQTVILRVQKRGRIYAISVYQKAVDKEEWTWTPVTEFTVLKFAPRLGIFAANKGADAAELPVRFENLVITPAK